jgi:DNA-directed RNA polymerase subunit M/transcription elongation factor TFIIS
MPDKTTTSDGRICPECNAHLYYGGNGRSLQCDRCDYRRPVSLTRSYNMRYLALNQMIGVRTALTITTSFIYHSLLFKKTTRATKPAARPTIPQANTIIMIPDIAIKNSCVSAN